MKCPPSIEEIIEIVRGFQGLPTTLLITPESRIVQDLGVDGDDGHDLLRKIEDKFLFSFVPDDGKWWDAFDVEPDSLIFGSEIFGWTPEGTNQVPLTIAMLHRAILRRLYFPIE